MERLDSMMLDLAARHAVRALGRVEPNPLVGCVLARRLRPGSGGSAGRGVGVFAEARSVGWEIIGIGHHRRFGGAHAEAEALRNAADRGIDPRGATAWVTLEPCNHTGKTGPCAQALREAGIAEVVIARADPNPISAGGAAALARAGVAVRWSGASPAAVRLAQPFVASLSEQRPWVIAKWAQTPEGLLAHGPGGSRWVSCARSRRRVHAIRARVGAIVTGVGTVAADDPALTVRRGRFGARGSVSGAPPLRVVLDSRARTPLDSQLARTARETATLVLWSDPADQDAEARAAALAECGAQVEACEASDSRVSLRAAMAALARRGVLTALLEAGPAVLAAAFRDGLLDEAWAFVARAAGDPALARAAAASVAPGLADSSAWAESLNARSGEDRLVVWRRTER